MGGAKKYKNGKKSKKGKQGRSTLSDLDALLVDICRVLGNRPDTRNSVHDRRMMSSVQELHEWMHVMTTQHTLVNMALKVGTGPWPPPLLFSTAGLILPEHEETRGFKYAVAVVVDIQGTLKMVNSSQDLEDKLDVLCKTAKRYLCGTDEGDRCWLCLEDLPSPWDANCSTAYSNDLCSCGHSICVECYLENKRKVKSCGICRKPNPWYIP